VLPALATRPEETTMPVHRFEPPGGRVVQLAVRSAALENNLLGDPHERTVAVYLPKEYDRADRAYPVFVGLAGFTGSGLKMLSWQSFGQSVPQRLDRLVAEGAMGPVVAVFPDAFTSLGGNQYVNSAAIGRWEDFLLEELLPRLEREFRVMPGPEHRAVFGKSSGGYGALVQWLRHGDRWGAVACHSGDIDFELAYRRDLPLLTGALAAHGGTVATFLEHVRDAPSLRGNEVHALMLLAMCASYDPDPDALHGIRLPVDPRTCSLIEERWARWLEHDPLRMIERRECRESLRRLRGLWIDCGFRDNFHLHYGARAFTDRLGDLGIDHVYEEFDGTHSGIDYRLDLSLPFLYRAVASD
jgi:hypothetical protein